MAQTPAPFLQVGREKAVAANVEDADRRAGVTDGVGEQLGPLREAGHLARDEIFAVVDAAREEGVGEIVVTHPDFPSQSLSFGDQQALAERGALLERCFTTPHTGKVTWERWLGNIDAAGPENSVLATDLGQVDNPPVEDGLALLVDRLLAEGFSEEDVRTMAVTNTQRLAGS